MRKNLYESVLNALLINGIGYKTDISSLFSDFAENSDLPTVYWNDRISLVNEYLDSMKANKHIHEYSTTLLPIPVGQPNRTWMDAIEVYASISHTGAEYIVNRNQFDVALSQLNTANKSHNSTRKWAITAVIISLLTMVFGDFISKKTQYLFDKKPKEIGKPLNKPKSELRMKVTSPKRRNP